MVHVSFSYSLYIHCSVLLAVCLCSSNFWSLFRFCFDNLIFCSKIFNIWSFSLFIWSFLFSVGCFVLLQNFKPKLWFLIAMHLNCWRLSDAPWRPAGLQSCCRQWRPLCLWWMSFHLSGLRAFWSILMTATILTILSQIFDWILVLWFCSLSVIGYRLAVIG